jgi:hypothetical protein
MRAVEAFGELYLLEHYNLGCHGTTCLAMTFVEFYISNSCSNYYGALLLSMNRLNSGNGG